MTELQPPATINPTVAVQKAVKSGVVENLRSLRKSGLRASKFGPGDLDRIMLVAWLSRADGKLLRELRLMGVNRELPNLNHNVFLHQFLSLFACTGNISGLEELKRWGLDARAVRAADLLPLELAARENQELILKHLYSFWLVSRDDIKSSDALNIALRHKSYNAAATIAAQAQ